MSKRVASALYTANVVLTDSVGARFPHLGRGFETGFELFERVHGSSLRLFAFWSRAPPEPGYRPATPHISSALRVHTRPSRLNRPSVT